MRIGIGIGEIAGQAVDLAGLTEQAKQAEADGFASAWLAHVFGFDAVMAATLAGRHTSRIELGTAVVPTYPRHPTAMAQQALTAQAALDGRFTLGIGLSHAIVIESMLGMSYARPFSHMKEYLSVLVPLVREGKVEHRGEEYRVNAGLNVPGSRPGQVLVAALAPRMLRLAGEVADGTITWMTGPITLREHTVPRIREAAANAGRPSPRVVAALPIAVTDDVRGAREIAAKRFQVYGQLPSYRAMLDRERVQDPSEVVIVGDEDAVGERLQSLSEVGVTDYLAVPFPSDPDTGPAASADRTRSFLVDFAKRAHSG